MSNVLEINAELQCAGCTRAVRAKLHLSKHPGLSTAHVHGIEPFGDKWYELVDGWFCHWCAVEQGKVKGDDDD